MLFERIYFCTECGLEKYKSQVHIQYKFVFRYNTNRFYRQNKNVYFKVLCMCKKCFNNFATEKVLMKRRYELQEREKMEDF